MRTFSLLILSLGFTTVALAAEFQTIELKDGGKILLSADKTMIHVTPTGKRARMKDGKTMETADGSLIMMKNNAVWRTITEKGTLSPK